MSFPLKEVLANWRNKEELGLVLAEYPLLRLLLFSTGFRIALVMFLLVVVTVALCVPRCWRTTPSGFNPVIKVSGLDLIQAWSLKRSAIASVRTARWEDALYSWQSAAARNFADPELTRGLLRTIVAMGGPTNSLTLALGRANWLLRLTAANQADVELVSRVYEVYRGYDLLLNLLEEPAKRQSPLVEARFLKALFYEGYIVAFAQEWPKAGPPLKNDRELGLFHAAYQAGWDAQNKILGRQALDKAKNEPSLSPLAHRLQLTVSRQRRDVPSYQESLRFLTELHQDTPLDHVNYWRLLTEEGQKADAIQRAKNFSSPPLFATDLIRVAEAMHYLGLREQSRGYMETHLPQFSYVFPVWTTYGELLLDDQQWNLALELAARIRQQSSVSEALAGFAYYLEGRGEIAKGRPAIGEAALRKIPGTDSKNYALDLVIAKNLITFGYPAIAKELLVKKQEQLDSQFNYWLMVFTAANECKDGDLMLLAGQKAFQLRPFDPVAGINYAATLITLRKEPEEAIKLTLQFYGQLPNSIPARINHSLALLQNNRTPEAAALLSTVITNRLSPMEQTALYLGWTEVFVNQKQYDRALEASALIDTNKLFPSERQWLQQAMQRMANPKL